MPYIAPVPACLQLKICTSTPTSPFSILMGLRPVRCGGLCAIAYRPSQCSISSSASESIPDTGTFSMPVIALLLIKRSSMVLLHLSVSTAWPRSVTFLALIFPSISAPTVQCSMCGFASVKACSSLLVGGLILRNAPPLCRTIGTSTRFWRSELSKIMTPLFVRISLSKKISLPSSSKP